MSVWSALRSKLDSLTLVLVAVVALATVLPVRGELAVALHQVTHGAIALLFFLHGAKLSTDAIWKGLTHWRLHGLIFATTFGLFPAAGLGLAWLGRGLLTPDLTAGFLFLCILPATVQSAIAFTSIARGNVAAAVCSASASTLIGIVVTPLLAAAILPSDQAIAPSLTTVGRVALQIFLPFALGQLARPWLGALLHRRAAIVKRVDQSSILFVVYLAFSEARVSGLWSRTSPTALALLVAFNAVLLALMLGTTTLLGRRLFAKEDEIALVFCGSKKSLASGVPMAQILFPAATAGAALLPLMLFHQLQLMVCAVLAERYARRPSPP